MARAMSTPVRTFSIGFEDADVSELERARRLRRRDVQIREVRQRVHACCART